MMRVLSFEAVGVEMAMPEVVEQNQMAARVQIPRHAGTAERTGQQTHLLIGRVG